LLVGDDHRSQLDAWLDRLQPPAGWSVHSLAEFERAGTVERFHAFLRSLSASVKGRRLPVLGGTRRLAPSGGQSLRSANGTAVARQSVQQRKQLRPFERLGYEVDLPLVEIDT